MRQLFGSPTLIKVMKRLRTIVLYAATFYQVLEIFSLYNFVKISRSHPLFFISNFSSFHLVSIIILFNESNKKHVLHLNLFIAINLIWLLIISWNIVFICFIGECYSPLISGRPLDRGPQANLSFFLSFPAPDEIRTTFFQDPIEHVLLACYVTCSVVLELIVILIRQQAVKGIET